MLHGRLDPIYEEVVTGKAEVRQLWQHSAIGTIAGCRVIEGTIARSSFARVYRAGEVILDKAKLTSLKTGKESINEISNGKDCGLTIDNFNDIIEGDIIEIYKLVRKNNIGKK